MIPISVIESHYHAIALLRALRFQYNLRVVVLIYPCDFYPAQR
jgi:hypothetical protein